MIRVIIASVAESRRVIALQNAICVLQPRVGFDVKYEVILRRDLGHSLHTAGTGPTFTLRLARYDSGANYRRGFEGKQTSRIPFFFPSSTLSPS